MQSDSCRYVLLCLTAFLLISARQFAQAAPPESGTFVTLPENGDGVDVYLRKRIELPPGTVVRAWTAVSATHEFVLFVNGKEASRSRYGRVASAFRLAEEVEDLAAFFTPGTNTLAMKVHRWSPGEAAAFLKAEVHLETDEGMVTVPIETDDSWRASPQAAVNWTAKDFNPVDWQPVKTMAAQRRPPRIREVRDTMPAVSLSTGAAVAACPASCSSAAMSNLGGRGRARFRRRSISSNCDENSVKSGSCAPSFGNSCS